MKFPTITIEGMIISADILDKIETGEADGQSPKHFGLEGSQKVKDEIARIWADCQDLWQVYSRQMYKIGNSASGAAETRRYWMLPLLGLLGYDAQNAKAEIVNEKTYAISHRAINLDGLPIHIMGFNDKLGEKRQDGGPRLSPHSLVQEYINITEHLYALVTNGLRLRLLRDNSRLIKQSYIEFDLQAMMEENHYADFAVMVRLLHATRMPKSIETGDESLIEQYHQESLDSGSRIREKLSEAVEKSIILLGTGFLQHPANDDLRGEIETKRIPADQFYQLQLRLIYRLLFLLVIEERQLVFPDKTDQQKRQIYYKYYGLSRLRDLSESRSLEEGKYSDLWISLRQTFRLYEDEAFGAKLGVQPLNGELFGLGGLGILESCSLDNTALLACIAHLSRYSDEAGRHMIRVNYAGLNVEEFGSVYEGLLEYAPKIEQQNSGWTFRFVKGTERSSSGTHYTPDELVLPLIKHSLDHIIQDKLKTPLNKDPKKSYDGKGVGKVKPTEDIASIKSEQEAGLLSIKVCDVACGSGHILLNAARRIAQALATVRSGEDQPSPEVLRPAIRDVISRCIYGVDKNPLAVELCKVALWLEAHNPGEPLSFLDHRIKCGDAIVGLAHMQELQNGISEEAFKSLSGDDKTVCRILRDKNKAERAEQKRREEYAKVLYKGVDSLAQAFSQLDAMPDRNPRHVCDKSEAYLALISGTEYMRLKTLADIQTAQFFLPKENASDCITDGTFREYLAGRAMQGQAVAKAMALAVEKRFFHWFLEFPEVMANGGFDCILGNPPFLGGKRISGRFGDHYLSYIKLNYAPAVGGLDFVTYFFRRIFTLIKENGFLSLIATNTISQGDTRAGGLDVIIRSGGTINHAVRSMRWPGAAAVEVALVTIYKGKWAGTLTLNRKSVQQITSYLDDAEQLGKPFPLKQNEGKSFIGSYVLGMGFILEPEEAQRLIELDPKNKEVLFPYLNGEDLNSRPNQSPSRWVINFHDWDLEKAKQYKEPFEIIERLVKPERTRKKSNGEFILRKPLPQKWWIYADKRPKLYRTIVPLERVMVVAQVAKYPTFFFVPKGYVYSMMTIVLSISDLGYYAVLSSTIHEIWIRKYGSSLETRQRYTPTDCFETFPLFIFSDVFLSSLRNIGQELDSFRSKLMTSLIWGLTNIINQFHNPKLPIIEVLLKCSAYTVEDITKHYGKETSILWNHLNTKPDTCSFAEAVAGIHELRRLHVQMDQAVLSAYGWDKDGPDGPVIDLRHDFYEVDYLPENDRIRFTIHPDARREVLKRLLLLNHRIHAEEVKAGLWEKPAVKSKGTNNNQIAFDV